MKIVFCSNFMNHHQEEFSLNLHELTNGNYYFIAYEPIDPERIKLGYEDMNKKHDFIVRAYESEAENKKAQKLINESDVVIFGSGDERALETRIKSGKLTFRVAERLLKRGLWFRFFPPKMLRTHNRFTKYKKYDNFKMLCSSAYTSYDLSLSGFSAEKCYKWGYFPPVKKYESIEKFVEDKKPKTILWVGRFIDWKHPEAPVLIAEKLKQNGCDFTMNLIGNGTMENQIRELVKEKDLESNVNVLGSLSPDKVREYMEKSEIFLSTSDFKEGWGAVLNEAMNSGGACVISHAIGAAPYLIENGINGVLYTSGNLDEAYKKVADLLDNNTLRQNISLKAYETIINLWNSDIAAKRFVTLGDKLLGNSSDINDFETGPCSRAQIIRNDWYGD